MKLGVIGGAVSFAAICTALGVFLHGLGVGNGDEVLAGLMMLVSCLSPGLQQWLATFRVIKDWSQEPVEPIPETKQKVPPMVEPKTRKRRVIPPSNADYDPWY